MVVDYSDAEQILRFCTWTCGSDASEWRPYHQHAAELSSVGSAAPKQSLIHAENGNLAGKKAAYDKQYCQVSLQLHSTPQFHCWLPITVCLKAVQHN